jgi:hypothetical protein
MAISIGSSFNLPIPYMAQIVPLGLLYCINTYTVMINQLSSEPHWHTQYHTAQILRRVMQFISYSLMILTTMVHLVGAYNPVGQACAPQLVG